MSTPSRTVYIVDDDESVRESLAFLLESYGMATRTFASGDEVLKHVEELDDGCLVLDYHMPQANGLEVLGTLRTRGVGLPVVLVTGGGTDDIESQANGAGVVAYLEKPVPDAQLLSVIDRALRGPASMPAA